MSNDGFIRESGRPDACEQAVRILDALKVNLATRLGREAESQESRDQEWARQWRDCMNRELNPFDEIHVSRLPLWAQSAYCYITDLEGFVELVEEVFRRWQRECNAYFQLGITAGREIERRNLDAGPRRNPFFPN